MMRSTLFAGVLLGGSLIAAACSPAAPKINAHLTQEVLRPVATQADFVRVLEARGFKCSFDANKVFCSWFEPMAFGQVTQAAVFAEGSFVDGMKSGEYVVQAGMTGP